MDFLAEKSTLDVLLSPLIARFLLALSGWLDRPLMETPSDFGDEITAVPRM